MICMPLHQRRCDSNLGKGDFDSSVVETAWAYHQQIRGSHAKGDVPVEVALGFKRGPEEDTVFVYFRLENEKRAELEAIATTRGCTIDELVSLAVTEFLASQGAQ
jgi:hypothetical protein